jgi:hypothetical protein
MGPRRLCNTRLDVRQEGRGRDGDREKLETSGKRDVFEASVRHGA